MGYCVPSNTQHDPTDLRRPNAPPVVLPPGFTQRRLKLGGYSTPVIERGPRSSTEAVVFMHGNPGRSIDFLGLLRSVPPGTRVVAFDLLGFGRSDKPWSFPYTLEASRPLLDRTVRQLGLKRVHLVGHDIGSVLGVDWAARHPKQLRSAVILAGGIVIGYQHHPFARVWRTPITGEEFQRGANRGGFKTVLNGLSPRPLPDEFLDRNYDTYDRATRCAILKAYRGMDDVSKLGREHARALRPYNRPALVIWGDRDIFLPRNLAYSNREGFPSAAVHVYENSGHWPFVDEERRTVALMNAFFRRHVREQAGKRIRLSVSPRTARRGRRTRFRVRTLLAGSPRQPVAGARVTIGGKRVTTRGSGRATLVVRPRRAGKLRVTARKAPLLPGRATVRVRPSRHRARTSPRLTG